MQRETRLVLKLMRKRSLFAIPILVNFIYSIVVWVYYGYWFLDFCFARGRDRVIYAETILGNTNMIMISHLYRLIYLHSYIMGIIFIILSALINVKLYLHYKERIKNFKIYWGIIIGLNFIVYWLSSNFIFSI